ncbi:hypothetical protein JD292_07280 [Leucobacter sp. CSA2]|uniref:Uncharacterized protein n=1 Tax=Leucobacter edaphi TaxID=2796472 RepID=A0A934QC11_9MICO|nr:hypothetical protein [Leucobacter edaphi]MBK0421874.1 hypothetical protein [Leucobacter edaphi]
MTAGMVVFSGDGGVVFHDAAGEEIGGFAAPWAKDAKNRPVPTRFDIDGQRVHQVIDTSNLTPADFPVVADPPVYVNYTRTSGTLTSYKPNGKYACV